MTAFDPLRKFGSEFSMTGVETKLPFKIRLVARKRTFKCGSDEPSLVSNRSRDVAIQRASGGLRDLQDIADLADGQAKPTRQCLDRLRQRVAHTFG
jgi:hypothetical protein